MTAFSIFGVRLCFEFGFFAAAALFLLCDLSGMGLPLLSGCIIHECGHILASVILGRDIESVTFTPCGIKMKCGSRLMSFSRDIIILLAGPAFNFAAAAFCFFIGDMTAFSVNVILGVYNLLPYRSLDGGSILSELLQSFGVFSDKPRQAAALVTAVLVIWVLYCYGIGNFYTYSALAALMLHEIFGQ